MVFRKRKPAGTSEGGQYAPDMRGKTPPAPSDAEPLAQSETPPVPYPAVPIISLTANDTETLYTVTESVHNHVLKPTQVLRPGQCPSCDEIRATPAYQVSENVLVNRASPLTVLSIVAIELANGPKAAAWTQASPERTRAFRRETLWLAPRTNNGSRAVWYNNATGKITNMKVKLVDTVAGHYLGDIHYHFDQQGRLDNYNVTEEMGTRRTRYNAQGVKDNVAFPSWLPNGTKQWWKNGTLVREELNPEDLREVNPSYVTSRITNDI